ncbi:MAG: acetyl-CoA carboxylase biotin carboxylase subunit [Thomasclavelia sp.]|nr:acetyl-CoA carboxylase biotin carboxylase subunit [Thomasclavelia sp.]
MFKKILIANRGEIAVRIIRTCKEMGIESVAVYSSADNDSLHVQLADEAVCIGGPKASDSYLNMSAILQVGTSLGCDAIHPGFGFLSENSTFARLVEECGMKFIGPSGDIIDMMGDKAQARSQMRKAKVPVVPGSEGLISTSKEAKEFADEIGYPVLIKASAGGGGRGMRKAFNADEVEELFNTAKAEAKACFGNDDMYIEKLILNPRHIEFQILGDNFGNVIHLGERDCSIQRRNQKMIEESPSKALNDDLRKRMGADAIKAASSVGYTNAGTIEFVLDHEGNYYFIEMNTRIQVEHPITEMVTGVDLIKEQIRIAANLPLTYKQEDIVMNGHAIECRINAEDPNQDFRPCPGKVNSVHIPGGFGVRVDSILYQGYVISSHYDSMIAKVIVHGKTRLEAIKKMRRVLGEMVIDGINTNQELQYYIMYHPEYIKGNFDTSFIENNLDKMVNN